MTKAQAVATGLTTGTTATGAGTCGGPSDGFLAHVPASVTSGWGRLYFDPTTGLLVAIFASPGIRTREGLELSLASNQQRCYE